MDTIYCRICGKASDETLLDSSPGPLELKRFNTLGSERQVTALH